MMVIFQYRLGELFRRPAVTSEPQKSGSLAVLYSAEGSAFQE